MMSLSWKCLIKSFFVFSIVVWFGNLTLANKKSFVICVWVAKNTIKVNKQVLSKAHAILDCHSLLAPPTNKS